MTLRYRFSALTALQSGRQNGPRPATELPTFEFNPSSTRLLGSPPLFETLFRLPAARNPGLWIRPTSYTRPWALPVSGFPSGAKIQLAYISTDNDIWEYLGPRFALHSSRGRKITADV